MKTFKAAAWDSDATGDNIYKELFENKKKRKKKCKPKLLSSDIDQDKKQKRKLKKIIKKYKDIKSSHLLNVQTDIQELKKERKRKISHQKDNLNFAVKINPNRETDNNHGKNKMKLVAESEKYDLENGITKKQKEMLKKFSSELNSLHDDSNRLEKEWLKEMKKQKELKKKLKDVGRKQKLLGDVIETKIKNKFDEDIHRVVLQKAIKIKLDSAKKPNENFNQKAGNEQRIINNIIHKVCSASYSQNDHITETLEAKKKRKLQEKLRATLSEGQVLSKKPVLTLRQKMMEKLKAARFRFLNEQIYTTSSKEAQKIFKSDPDAFTAYHEGYRQQVKSWPLNPLDVIIRSIKNMPKTHVVADFGCGDAKLAKSVNQKVHSFDLVAVDETVIACDMSRVPLEDDSVDMAVFCLSLMGTNLQDYLLEANRVLKVGGVLKIAEVESRFEDVNSFIEGVKRFGFKKTWMDLSYDLFYFIDFKKQTKVKNKKKLPTISLLPCLYKKR